MYISVPATSANLGPGFDSLGVAINLRNAIKIKKSTYFSISVKGEGEKNPKLKGNNLFINIFNEYYYNLTGKKDNFRFLFYNNIPMSRGLGSSSAVIVSAIMSAYEASNISISKEKLLNLALNYESHPDNITPAVMGGFNVAVVENNKVLSIRKNMPNYLKAVVVIPDKAISTAQSRTTLPNYYSKKDAVYNLSHSSLVTGCFLSENWELLKYAAKDKFHQAIRMKNMPELFEVQKIALLNGALMSTLSGSGSSFFNLSFEDNAINIQKKIVEKYPNFKVEIFDFDNKGVYSK
ncbi:MAG: homoserine kinase [Campylobacterales bacterium]|nr:homoserine kinase [Campylobacterales bacterium]